MGKIFSSSEVVGIVDFVGTAFSDYTFGEVNFFGTAFLGDMSFIGSTCDDGIYGEIDFVQQFDPQFGYVYGAVNFTDPNYFPSLSVNDEEDPLPEELCATFGSNVYVVCPDIQEGWQIPYSELLECNLQWFGNTPITGNIKLKNSDRKYTNPDDEYFGGIFTEEEIWSNIKNSRKFLYVGQMSKCGDKTSFIMFPRLVITSVSGTHTLTVNFVDEISYYLFYRKTTLATYCFEEALTRIDKDTYASYTLTEFYYERNGINKMSEFYVNSKLKTPNNLNYTKNTLRVPTSIENENIPVVLRNPKLVKELISDIIKATIDSQTGDITKEYLNVEMYFEDFTIYNTVEIQDTDIITVLKNNFFDAIPADFYIKPILNYQPYHIVGSIEANYLASSGLKPTLVIQDCVLEDEFSYPNCRIPESIVRGECEPKLTGLNKFNSKKVMKPGVIGKSYVLEVSDVTVEDEALNTPPIQVPTDPQISYYGLRFHPVIPLIWIEQTGGINYCRYGTINDVTTFQTETTGYNSDTDGMIWSWSEMFSSYYWPDGYTGIRSGTLEKAMGTVYVILLWDEPYYEQPNEYQRVV